MKAVILAAGRGSRMKNLTTDLPKPLLKHNGKALIENKLECVANFVDEIIIVIGYLGEKIIAEYGDFYNLNGDKKIPIKYVWQKELLGTADALWSTQNFLMTPDSIDSRFVVLMADDMYSPTDMEKLVKESQYNDGKNWAMLTYESEKRSSAAKFIVDKNNNLLDIIEDPNGEIDYNYVYTGACVLSPEIFTMEMTRLSNGEFGLPQTILKFNKQKDIKIILTKNWYRITTPEDLK